MRKPGKLKRGDWRQRFTLGRNLVKDEAGAVLVYMAVLIPVMMGVIGLTIDGTRFYILNTELQDLADASALAGARELDGTDEGLVRAQNAARDVVTNDARWANDAEPEFQIVLPVRFCEGLDGPPSRRTCVETFDSALADFIEVIAEPRRVGPSFIAAVAVFTGEAAPWLQTGAIAIAGTSIIACQVQPLMLCNPYEDPTGVNNQPFTATPGQMFHFKQKSNTPNDGNWYSPGDFGLLDPPGQDSSTGPQLRQLLSQQSPTFCYINRVSPRPGQNVGNIDDAINVRFDLPLSGNTHGMDQTPAPNVLKGIRSTHANDACNYSGNHKVDTPSARLPRDTDLATPAGARNVRVGSGAMSQTAKDAYWNYHYGTGWPGEITTRFQAYMRELGENGSAPMVTGPENRPPQCAPVSPFDYKRRIISVAIVNCAQEGVRGNSASNVRSDTYADFFITEPADGGEIFTEFIRVLTPDAEDSRLKRIIQLYR